MHTTVYPARSRTTRVTSKLVIAGLAVVAFVASANVHAQFSQAQFGVGVELERVSDLYRGVGSEIKIWPVLTVESEDFQFRKNEGKLKVYRHDLFDVSLKGQYRLDHYWRGDSSFFNGMSERGGAFELGVALTSTQWFGELEASALTDISSRHRGYELALSYGYPLALQGARIVPEVSMTWQSENLVNYYWGVGAGEARPGRPEYNPGGSLTLAIGVQYQRQVGRHHRFTGRFAVERPGQDIDDSPLRDPDEAYRLSVGYVYLF